MVQAGTGVMRMPIEPTGWVSVHARAMNGPTFLEMVTQQYDSDSFGYIDQTGKQPLMQYQPVNQPFQGYPQGYPQGQQPGQQQVR